MMPPTLHDLSTVLTGSVTDRVSHDSIRKSRMRATTILMLTDALAMSAAIFGVIGVRALSSPDTIPLASYIPVIIAVMVMNAIVSAWRGIYPGYGMCAIAELRTTFYSLTSVFAAVIMVSFFTRGVLPYSRSILFMAWLLGLPVLAGSRMLVRRWLSHKPWYGIPVLIVGENSLAKRIVDSLRNNLHIGLRPMVIIEPNESSAEYGYYQGVPVIGGERAIGPLSRRYGLTHGIVALPNVTSEQLSRLIEGPCRNFSHITFVGDHVHPSVVWISNVANDPVVSAELEQRLRQPALAWKKRLFDLVFTIPLLVMTAPFMALIGIMIKLSSTGPIMYRQKRVGYRGELFNLLKFRTMVSNAEGSLEDILQNRPEYREEWDRYHKLKNDPRVTRIGQWLRKYSLDELPQIWNIIRGEMSLVGSRPVLPSEVADVSENARDLYMSMYLSTKPGLSGLWQVTVRNEAEFESRIHIDLYYMRNWSLFLDFYIILRTIGVVLSGRGAY